MITTQKALRNEFWYQHPQLKRGPKRKKHNDYPTDIRVAWCYFVEATYRSHQISEALAQRATL